MGLDSYVRYPFGVNPTDAEIKRLDREYSRLLKTARTLRDSGSVAAGLALESFYAVLPQLPGILSEHLPEADAQIYTQNQMRKLLIGFAIKLVRAQVGALHTVTKRGSTNDRMEER